MGLSMVEAKRNSNLNDPEREPTATRQSASSGKERYDSDELFGDRKEILIIHHDEIYRLRRTRHNKLILYK
jgi:hemin uptake protein HemP